MYLHATDKVMKDDNLLALFDIRKFSGLVCASRGNAAVII